MNPFDLANHLIMYHLFEPEQVDDLDADVLRQLHEKDHHAFPDERLTR